MHRNFQFRSPGELLYYVYPIIIWLVIITCAFVFDHQTLHASTISPNGSASDCGVQALYLLLQLHGRQVDLEQVSTLLMNKSLKGHSMAELATASQRLGLSLNGFQFGVGDQPLDQPAIVYFNDGREGHFAIIRPVGITGTMVQLIDPPNAPMIIDYSQMFKGKSWTNRILLVANPWPRRLFISLVVFLIALFLMILIRFNTGGPGGR